MARKKKKPPEPRALRAYLSEPGTELPPHKQHTAELIVRLVHPNTVEFVKSRYTNEGVWVQREQKLPAPEHIRPIDRGCDAMCCSKSDEGDCAFCCLPMNRHKIAVVQGVAIPKPTPVPLILHCPECRARHVDEGEFAIKTHTSHACQSCGFVWRPAVVPTVGVKFLPGFKNDLYVCPCGGKKCTREVCYGPEAQPECDHGVTFDEKDAAGLDAYEVRKRWPRLDGECPKGCGYRGIGYASQMHYLAGDW